MTNSNTGISIDIAFFPGLLLLQLFMLLMLLMLLKLWMQHGLWVHA